MVEKSNQGILCFENVYYNRPNIISEYRVNKSTKLPSLTARSKSIVEHRSSQDPGNRKPQKRARSNRRAVQKTDPFT